MIAQLKKISSHSVARNSIALFVLQFVSLIAPLIVLPYLSRVLGIDGFGIIMLALSACAISLVITDFGFNLSATYQIAKERDNIDYVNELIGSIFIIKFILVLVILVPVAIYHYYITPIIKSDILLSYIGLNILLQSVIPTWFFQGVEKMKNVTIYMMIAKTSYVLLVFLYIKEKSDINEVILFFALSNLIAATVAIASIYKLGYAIKRPVLVSVSEIFKDSFQFFVSRAAVSIYTSASTFLVGTFAGVQQAAMYGASEKLYQASQSITNPVAQALFPYMAKSKDIGLLMKIILGVGIPLTLGCFFVGMWANEIMALIFGDDFFQSGGILQLFLIVTVINFVSVIFGYPAFSGIGRVHVANYTVMMGALIQLTCLCGMYMTDSFSALNVVGSVLITESIVMLSRVTLFIKYK